MKSHKTPVRRPDKPAALVALERLEYKILGLKQMASIAADLVEREIGRPPDGELVQLAGGECVRILHTNWEIERLIFATQHVTELAKILNDDFSAALEAGE